MCPPSLFGLAIAILRELLESFLYLQKLVELYRSFPAFFKCCFDQFGRLDRERSTVR